MVCGIVLRVCVCCVGWMCFVARFLWSYAARVLGGCFLRSGKKLLVLMDGKVSTQTQYDTSCSLLITGMPLLTCFGREGLTFVGGFGKTC